MSRTSTFRSPGSSKISFEESTATPPTRPSSPRSYPSPKNAASSTARQAAISASTSPRHRSIPHARTPYPSRAYPPSSQATSATQSHTTRFPSLHANNHSHQSSRVQNATITYIDTDKTTDNVTRDDSTIHTSLLLAQIPNISKIFSTQQLIYLIKFSLFTHLSTAQVAEAFNLAWKDTEVDECSEDDVALVLNTFLVRYDQSRDALVDAEREGRLDKMVLDTHINIHADVDMHMDEDVDVHEYADKDMDVSEVPRNFGWDCCDFAILLARAGGDRNESRLNGVSCETHLRRFERVRRERYIEIGQLLFSGGWEGLMGCLRRDLDCADFAGEDKNDGGLSESYTLEEDDEETDSDGDVVAVESIVMAKFDAAVEDDRARRKLAVQRSLTWKRDLEFWLTVTLRPLIWTWPAIQFLSLDVAWTQAELGGVLGVLVQWIVLFVVVEKIVVLGAVRGVESIMGEKERSVRKIYEKGDSEVVRMAVNKRRKQKEKKGWWRSIVRTTIPELLCICVVVGLIVLVLRLLERSGELAALGGDAMHKTREYSHIRKEQTSMSELAGLSSPLYLARTTGARVWQEYCRFMDRESTKKWIGWLWLCVSDGPGDWV